MPKQTIPIKYIYKTNNINTFYIGTKMLEPDVGDEAEAQCGGLAFFILHAITLPLSILVAHIKTLIDYSTRKSISLDDLKMVKINLRLSSDPDFDEYVDKIKKYEARSNASQELISNLIRTSNDEKEAKRNLYSDIEQKMIEVKSQFAEDHEQIANNIQKLKETLKTKSAQLEKIRRQKQKYLIIEYMQNFINAGKRLQNIIVNETRKFVK